MYLSKLERVGNGRVLHSMCSYVLHDADYFALLQENEFVRFASSLQPLTVFMIGGEELSRKKELTPQSNNF